MKILNTPLTIKNLTLKNRILLPPMAVVKGDMESRVTDELVAYYDEKAASGIFGLIVTEHCFVSPEGQASERQLSVSRDSDISGLQRIAEVIHKHGVPVIAQINHAGGAAKRGVTHLEPLSPSGVHSPGLGDPDLDPAILTPEEMDRIAEDFAAAAARVKEAGFDGVEIHAAHAYLLCQFLSPITNLREDFYGGKTMAERLRFPLMVTAAVRKTVGPDYPISLRLGACDYLPGGNTPAEAAEAACAFADAGIDLFDVSGGLCYYRRPGHKEAGYFSDQVREIRKALLKRAGGSSADGAKAGKWSVGAEAGAFSVAGPSMVPPVVLTGGIGTAQEAEAFLEDGTADLIGLGRCILNGTWKES